MESNFLIDWIIPLAVATMMCGIGMSLTVDDFKRSKESPKAIIIGLFLQLVMLPSVGFVLAELYEFEPELAVGVIILCVCPGGPISNLFSFLAKADTALSVMLTAIGTLITIISIPFLVNLAIDYYLGENSQFSLPIIETIARLLLFVLVPISIGMIIRNRHTEFAKANQVNIERSATLFMLVLVIGIIISERDNMTILLEQAGPLSISLYVIMITISFIIGLLFKLDYKQRRTIAIESAIQNIPLAFVIAATLLNSPTMAIPSAVYSVVNLLFTFLLVSLLARFFTPVADRN